MYPLCTNRRAADQPQNFFRRSRSQHICLLAYRRQWFCSKAGHRNIVKPYNFHILRHTDATCFQRSHRPKGKPIGRTKKPVKGDAPVQQPLYGLVRRAKRYFIHLQMQRFLLRQAV